MLELWAGHAETPLHSFVPRGVDDAAAFLRGADPRELRAAALALGGYAEHDDDAALYIVARAWTEGRLSLHERVHVVGRTEPHDELIQNLADLADSASQEPTLTFIEIQVVFEGDVGCTDAKVRVLTPDGDVHEGTLDADSKFRVDDIERGTCMLEFPEILPLPDASAGEPTITPPTGQTARVARNGRLQLRAGASHLVIVAGACFEFAVDLGAASAWPSGSKMRLAGGPYDESIALANAPAEHGLTLFHFHGVRRGVDYTLSFEPAGGDPITLAQDRSLDGFLDVLGDLQAAIEPLEICALTPPEPEPASGVASAGRPQAPDNMAVAQVTMPWSNDPSGTQLA